MEDLDFLEDYSISSIVVKFDLKLEEYKRSSEKDKEIIAVKNYVKNGWPIKISSVKPEAKLYVQFKREIHEWFII